MMQKYNPAAVQTELMKLNAAIDNPEIHDLIRDILNEQKRLDRLADADSKGLQKLYEKRYPGILQMMEQYSLLDEPTENESAYTEWMLKSFLQELKEQREKAADVHSMDLNSDMKMLNALLEKDGLGDLDIHKK
ncbi:MAG: hypothetical protein IJ130_10355 [Solobacterium sp.]|nr:hypothetical protein [Solobacterium sp.]